MEPSGPPPVFTYEDLPSIRPALRTATREMRDRGLTSSAKWAAELLISSPVASTSSDPHPYRTSTPIKGGAGPRFSLSGVPPIGLGARPRESMGGVIDHYEGSSPAHGREHGMIEEADEHMSEGAQKDEAERDLYEFALSLYTAHELLRAAHVLRECTGPKARWLRTYAKFLAGDKRAQEENGELLGPKDKNAGNPFAQELLVDMGTWDSADIAKDGYLLYLKALLLLSLPPLTPSPSATRDPAVIDPRLVALDLLLKSVTLAPYNWAAWLKLTSSLDGTEEFEALLPLLPTSFASMFFYVHATLEIHAASDSLHSVVDQLAKIFGDCPMLKGTRGLIHYHVREFDEATQYFTDLRKIDPHRVEDIDIFSNILYVSEKRAELAMLAQEYVKMDRARPEVCCLIGNYYSLRRDHEKAILYFRRALKLDRSYLSAWTLMGHEYVEIKNTNAAIASYRRAVDVNRKDYRAWYGLGQTYELLGESFYAINYYQKATALRPYDARMWAALAVCYEKLKKVPDAIKAYQRALVSSEPGETDTCLRIGVLFALIGDVNKAAAYHRRALEEGVEASAPRSELSKIRIWLAKNEIDKERRAESTGDLAAAEEHLKEAMQVQEDKDEAAALMKEVQTLNLTRM